MLAVILGLLVLPTGSEAMPVADQCTDYPEPRTYLEIHTWWEGAPAPAGHIPHLHAEACVPLGQTVSGTLTFDTRIVLHDTDGTLFRYETALFAFSGGGGDIDVKPQNMTCGLDRTCEAWVRTTLDTSTVRDGWHGLRFKPRLRLSDGSVMLTSGDWPICVRSCSGPMPHTVGRGWYDQGHDYQSPVYTEPAAPVLPGATVSGTWNAGLRLDHGSGGFEPTQTSAFVDSDWHHFDEDSDGGGRLLGQWNGPFRGTLPIDTTRLANGRHELILRVEAARPDGRLVALQYVPFVVANGGETLLLSEPLPSPTATATAAPTVAPPPPTPPPTANFSGTPTSGTAPLAVQFTDSSTGAPTGWAWDFTNDGVNDSTLQSPSHTYTAAGTYSVKLTTTNGGGSDTETKTNYISVAPAPTPPTANFSGSPTSGTAPLTVAFADSSTGGATSWAWDFTNDGVTDSTLQNPSHTYTAAGTYTVKLTASNTAGSDVEIKTNYVTVTSTPPPPPPGDGTTFQPVADSYVNSGYVNSNYGTQTSVRATNQHRPYLQFTVSGLNGAPSRVMLRLYVTDPSPHGGDLYLVGNVWTERGITWANAPALPATPHATGRAATLNTWYEFDVTSLVTGNGTYSFALRTTSTNGTLYASRESTTNRPELVVTP